MMPLVDDYLQKYIVDGLRFLKEHPNLIDRIFLTGKRNTLNSLKEFITKKSIKVVIGYPKDQTSLPCYVISLAPEQEVPLGLGDGEEEYLDYEGELGNNPDATEIAINEFSEYINGTYMNSNYRVECWSDNGDLTSYMYIILKWCLLTSKSKMIQNGWVNISLSGTDLEPVPDYMPIFIYRRSIQINLQYENLYYNNIENIRIPSDVIQNPENYGVDEEGNVILKETGDIVIPYQWVWVIRAHYYIKSTDGIEYSIHENGQHVYRSETTESGELKTKVVQKLPAAGVENTLYILCNVGPLSEKCNQYLFKDGKYKPVGLITEDMEEYTYNSEKIDEKDDEVLENAQEYTDNKEYTPEDIGLGQMGSEKVIGAFNSIFGE